jgi:hypothetical protein
MTPRDIYSSYGLVAGVLLLVLGIGNWGVGAVQIAKYQGLLQYNAARVKLDFYYVVLSGGRVFFLFGALVTFFSLIRVIRQDTLTKMRRLASPSVTDRR